MKSPTDSIARLEAKILDFLSLGARVGILINPDDRTIRTYCSNQATVTLQDGEILTIPDLLPGWSAPIAELWLPEF